jgi:hypothetical protein
VESTWGLRFINTFWWELFYSGKRIRVSLYG